MKRELMGLFLSQQQNWRTPQYLFDALHSEFDFTVDAAATPGNALLPRYWTELDNALVQDWKNERIFCNPPYGGNQIPFIKKAARCEAEVSVFIIPARPESATWHNYIFKFASEIRFLRGRIKFIHDSNPKNNGSPFPTSIIVFRKQKLNLPEQTQLSFGNAILSGVP